MNNLEKADFIRHHISTTTNLDKKISGLLDSILELIPFNLEDANEFANIDIGKHHYFRLKIHLLNIF